MKRAIHNLLCTVSRRYRIAHCRHVDELPPHMSRRLFKECMESIEPKSYADFGEMLADMEREWDAEDRAEAAAKAEREAHPGFFRRVAALFA